MTSLILIAVGILGTNLILWKRGHWDGFLVFLSVYFLASRISNFPVLAG